MIFLDTSIRKQERCAVRSNIIFLDTRMHHSFAKRAFQEKSNSIESLESRISLKHRDTEVVSEKKRKEYFRRSIMNRPRKTSFIGKQVYDLFAYLACIRVALQPCQFRG